jgi:hypothetical protein
MCRTKDALDVPKIETTEYVPSSAAIDEAIAARRGLRALIRHGDEHKLAPHERKSLSAFSFGTNQFMMAPEMSNQVLSCLVDPSDLSGLVSQVNISAGSIKFLIDNARRGWARGLVKVPVSPTTRRQTCKPAWAKWKLKRRRSVSSLARRATC